MNNEIAVISNPVLEAMSLEELFGEAAKYGKVTIFSSSTEPHPNCYKADIEFNTKQHTKMEAGSSRNQPIKSALIEAINNAQDMVRLAMEIQK